MPQKITLLGLGIMGTGMAHRLLGAGFDLTVYNRTASRAKPLAMLGAKIADSPRQAAQDADAILCMVADDRASRAMWLGKNGALAGAKKGTLLVDSSTISVDWAGKLANLAAKKRLPFLDAPVTGSRPQAAAGELLFLVGGSSATLNRARPILKTMSKDMLHIGPTGSGALIKLINNFVCGVQAASLAEAIGMIESSRLNRKTALAVLTGGAPGSPLIKTISTRMTHRDYTPNFLLRLMAKDLTYARREGARLGVSLTTASTALKLLKKGIRAGLANKDFSSIVEIVRKSARHAK